MQSAGAQPEKTIEATSRGVMIMDYWHKINRRDRLMRMETMLIGIVLNCGLEIRFHTMSLPTAWLVWHCPYIVIFTSEDGRVNGEKYKEYVLVRADGHLDQDALIFDVVDGSGSTRAKSPRRFRLLLQIS